MTASAIYRGVIEHVRHVPVVHRFRYRLFMLYLDLDELEQLFRGRWFWSLERLNVASFHRSDYLGNPGVPLRTAVLDEVEAAVGRRPEGPVRLLTLPRCFGVCFNPVSFYYCHDRDGRLDAVVAEITNTPWNERHRYVVAQGSEAGVGGRFAKGFHISPFMPMHQAYDWWFGVPGDQLAVRMRSFQNDDRVFDATLELTRRPWAPRALAQTLAVHPFMTAKILLGIYFQALRLKFKRVPFHPHPSAFEDTSR